jgi:hypothetical protein
LKVTTVKGSHDREAYVYRPAQIQIGEVWYIQIGEVCVLEELAGRPEPNATEATDPPKVLASNGRSADLAEPGERPEPERAKNTQMPSSAWIVTFRVIHPSLKDWDLFS